MLRPGLRARFTQEAARQVVGEAENGEHLLAQLLATPCDVGLLDRPIPGLDGLVTTQRLRAEFPEGRVLLRSRNDHALARGQVREVSAQGYGLKNARHDESLVGVRAVAAGKRWLCSELGLPMLGQGLSTETELTAK